MPAEIPFNFDRRRRRGSAVESAARHAAAVPEVAPQSSPRPAARRQGGIMNMVAGLAARLAERAQGGDGPTIEGAAGAVAEEGAAGIQMPVTLKNAGLSNAPEPTMTSDARETRPRVAARPDPVADIRRRRDELAAQRNPKDRDGRLKSGVKEAARAFMGGGGLVGAATGLAHGLIAPNVNERHDRDREIGRLEGEEARAQKGRLWQMAVRKNEADIENTEAQTEYTRQRPDIDRQRAETAEERVRVMESLGYGRLGQGDRKLDQGDVKLAQDDRKIDQGDRRIALSEKAQKELSEFRKTKLYSDVQQKTLDRQTKVSEGAKNRASAEKRTGMTQEGANARSAASIASQERRALTGRRFSLAKLALQAEKEGKSLQELVREVDDLGGEVYDDQP